MSDEDGRAGDPPQRAFHRGDIACKCVEAVLGGDHLMSIRLKRGNHLVEARTVGQIPWQKTMLGLVCIAVSFALLRPSKDTTLGETVFPQLLALLEGNPR